MRSRPTREQNEWLTLSQYAPAERAQDVWRRGLLDNKRQLHHQRRSGFRGGWSTSLQVVRYIGKGTRRRLTDQSPICGTLDSVMDTRDTDLDVRGSLQDTMCKGNACTMLFKSRMRSVIVVRQARDAARERVVRRNSVETSNRARTSLATRTRFKSESVNVRSTRSWRRTLPFMVACFKRKRHLWSSISSCSRKNERQKERKKDLSLVLPASWLTHTIDSRSSTSRLTA